MLNIPNDFTACEEYRGYVIAIKAGRYYAFKGRGQAVGECRMRSTCRTIIDGMISDSRDADRWEARNPSIYR